MVAGEVPEEPFRQLGAEAFKDREEAEQRLLQWARKHAPESLQLLHRKALETDDPEREARCFDILRVLVGEQFDNQGQGFIGIQMAEVMVKHPETGQAMAGIRVTHLLKGFPAEKAGLQINDILLSCNGARVPEGEPALQWFPDEIRAIPPNTKARFQVLRGAELIQMEILLVKRPHDGDLGMPQLSPEKRLKEEQRKRERHFQRWLEMQHPRR